MSYILFPRLSGAAAFSARGALQSGKLRFDEMTLEEAFTSPTAFPATGGLRISYSSLIEMRARFADVWNSLRGAGGLTPQQARRQFDLDVGRLLFDVSQDSTAEFGNASVWDFLTLVLLPDLAFWRFSVKEEVESVRFIGGNRRHIFGRLWRRWNLLGAEVVESGRLTEDDYLQLLERDLTGGDAALSRRIVEIVLESGLAGDARRDFMRGFVRQLTQISGLVEITSSDGAHLDSVLQHAEQRTLHILPAR